MSKVLRKGYTTGAHTAMAFHRALEAFIASNDLVFCKTEKIDNDDLDVTKGCEIIVTLSSKLEELTLNDIEQQAHEFKVNDKKLYIYGGSGVGIVTKKGLKIAPSFAAINPTPLQAMQALFERYVNEVPTQMLYCTISVTDGENIARHTANEKVGVLGGISILGTTGIVKPVSSSAYIDSVKTEIEFAHANQYEVLYFTLGNSAFNVAKKQASEEQIIEIGNFVYDSIEIIQELKVPKVIFLCGIGKMTKVYQGFKNTHNRFGVIDFKQLQQDINDELNYEVDIESTLTVKGISQELEKVGLLEPFYEMITKKSNEQIQTWFNGCKVQAIILEQKEVLGW